MEYDCADDMWSDAIKHILDRGSSISSRDGNCREILAWSGKLRDLSSTLVVNAGRKLSGAYAAAEVLWYLSGESSIERIAAYAPQYARFAEGGVAYGAYGARLSRQGSFRRECEAAGLRLSSQLTALCDLLAAKSNTRQAVATMWSAGDLVHAILGDHADLPCTLSLQFIARERVLHCIATMRSNDVWLGMPYDVFAFTCLQRLIAQSCGMRTGSYTHQVGSLHLYERNAPRAAGALSCCRAASPSRTVWAAPARVVTAVGAQVRWACELERRIRGGEATAATATARLDELDEMLRDFVLACARKWDPSFPGKFVSDAMREVSNADH